MKALTEKFKTVERVASTLGVKDEAIRKWREREAIPGRWHLKLIAASRGKLKPADFMEDD